MTGMPEATLARELEMHYACCAVVVNPAAGKGQGIIDMDTLNAAVISSMKSARAVITSALAELA
jgi:5'-methylthioinosine phosphorylase